MAYKKYITVNGKKYGPYYYQSYRDESGKVRKRYVKEEDYLKGLEENKKGGVPWGLVFIILSLFFIGFFIVFGIFYIMKPVVLLGPDWYIGNYDWEKLEYVYGKSHDVEADSNGDVYIVGGKYAYADYAYIFKRDDVDGEIIWEYFIEGDEYYGGESITKSLVIKGDYLYTISDYYASDILVHKFDLDGSGTHDYVWEKEYNVADTLSSLDIALDSSDNIFVSFRKRTGDKESFLMKYDNSGNELWEGAKEIVDGSGISNGSAESIFVKGSDLYICGMCPMESCYAEGCGAYNSKSFNHNFCILKYDLDGNRIWKKSYETDYSGGCRDLIVSDNYIYAGGYIDLDIREGYQYVDFRGYFFKSDLDGSLVWDLQTDYSGDIIEDIDVYSEGEGVYIAGHGYDNVGGFNKGFVKKYEDDGSGVIWTTNPINTGDYQFYALDIFNPDVFYIGGEVYKDKNDGFGAQYYSLSSRYSVPDKPSVCPTSQDNWVVDSDFVLDYSVECNTITINEGVTLTIDNSGEQVSVDASNLEVYGKIEHVANVDSKVHWIDLIVGNLNIYGSGSIDASGKGRSGGSGYGLPGDVSGGAGHGGQGSAGDCGGIPGSAYDDLVYPKDLGSSHYSSSTDYGEGGGLIFINANNIDLKEGSFISVDGRDGSDSEESGGGSGGSIFINTSTMTGIGSIFARGAEGGDAGCGGGGGAGGRVSIYTEIDDYEGNVDVSGGLLTGTPAEDGSFFECDSVVGVSCYSDVSTYGGKSVVTEGSGVKLVSEYSDDTAINITKNFSEVWSKDRIEFREESSDDGCVGYYNIEGLYPEYYYDVWDNGVKIKDDEETDVNGVLPQFEIALSSPHDIIIQENGPVGDDPPNVVIVDETMDIVVDDEVIFSELEEGFCYESGIDSTAEQNSQHPVSFLIRNDGTVDADVSVYMSDGTGYEGGLFGEPGNPPYLDSSIKFSIHDVYEDNPVSGYENVGQNCFGRGILCYVDSPCKYDLGGWCEIPLDIEGHALAIEGLKDDAGSGLNEAVMHIQVCIGNGEFTNYGVDRSVMITIEGAPVV